MRDSRTDLRNALNNVVAVLSDGEVDAKSRAALKRVHKTLIQTLHESQPSWLDRVRLWLPRFGLAVGILGSVLTVIMFLSGL